MRLGVEGHVAVADTFDVGRGMVYEGADLAGGGVHEG